MNISFKALHFGTGPSDAGICLAWHHPLDVTWRWQLCLDYFWRSEGFSGPVLPVSRRHWKWKYLIPRARLPLFHSWIDENGKKRRILNPHFTLWASWLGLTLSYSQQPKWDRNFDPEAAQRAAKADTYRSDVRKAIDERKGATLQ